MRRAPRPAPDRTPGIWSRHLDPAPDAPFLSDMWADAVRLRIEEQVSATIPVLVAAGVPREDAAETAANYVFQQALAMQRDASPKGQAAMLATLLETDSNLEGIRRGLYGELRKRSGRAAVLGFVLGWTCALAAAALGSLLFG